MRPTSRRWSPAPTGSSSGSLWNHCALKKKSPPSPPPRALVSGRGGFRGSDMTNEVKCWCRHCKEELPPDHTGPCPKCGKRGKDCKVTATDVVGIKASLSGTHKPKWSSNSFALFFGLTGVFLAIVIPGILLLLPFGSGVNYGILVCILLVMGGALWWKRYNILMLLRILEGKFGGEKKF